MKKNQEGASTIGAEYDTISAEIQKAVEDMPVDASTDTPEKPVETAAETPPETAEAPAQKADAPEAFTVGDAEIERAVRAGLSVADARAFTDKGAFERVCAMLEAKAASSDDKKISADSGKDAKPGDDDSADFDVPEITEDEEFDPKLVKLGSVVRKMGDALKAMREENKSLHERLGRFEKAGDGAERAAKVEDRNKSLRLAPPGGVRGQRKEKTEDDILAEVAGEISSKFDI